MPISEKRKHIDGNLQSMNLVRTPNCPKCVTTENLVHTFMVYPRYEAERRVMLNRLWQQLTNPFS